MLLLMISVGADHSTRAPSIGYGLQLRVRSSCGMLSELLSRGYSLKNACHLNLLAAAATTMGKNNNNSSDGGRNGHIARRAARQRLSVPV